MGINCAVGKAKLWESECEEQILILRGMERNALELDCQNIYIYIYIYILYIIYQISEI